METRRTADAKSRVMLAMFLMVALSVLLFWLPIIGPLIAGFVGGRTARRLDLVLLAAPFPALLIGLLSLFGWYYIPYPLAGLLTGGEFVNALLFDSLPLMLGAVLAAILP